MFSTSFVQKDNAKHIDRFIATSYKPAIQFTLPGKLCQSKYACFQAGNKIYNGQQCGKFIFHSIHMRTN